MAERYRRILNLEEMYFQEESPLLLEKAALLFDQQKEINIFQGKFINMQSSPIAAVYIDITCFDITGKKLGTIQGIYLDMDIRQNSSFGSNVPIEIPYTDARKFAFKITKIAYTNGNINEINLPIHSIAQVESISESNPYAEQYIREISLLNPRVNCKNILMENSEYWICPCGVLNSKKNKICRNCDLNIDELTKLSDESYLLQRHMEYEEEVRKNKELKQKQEETRRRKIHNRLIKLVRVFLAGAVVLVTLFLLTNYLILPKYYSSEAEKYIKDKKFDDAEETYQKITSKLRSSKELDGYYNFCIMFLSQDDIESAEKCYTKIRNTEKVNDSELNDLWKEACIKEANNDHIDNMLLCYSNIKNQKELENEELNNTFMECGKKLLLDMDFENAKKIYLSKVADKYSTSLENIYYETAVQLIEKGNYIEAIDNCFYYISAEHLDGLSSNLKKAYILSIEEAYSDINNINNFRKIQKYLSQEDLSSIQEDLYFKAKKSLNINGKNTFSEYCFAQLKDYKDSDDYNKLLGAISNNNLTQRYKSLRKMKIPFAKKYIKENDDLKKVEKICGEWISYHHSWVITVNITMDKGAHIVYYYNESNYRKGKKFMNITEDICCKSNELYEELWDHKITLTDSGKLELRFDDDSGSYTCSRR